MDAVRQNGAACDRSKGLKQGGEKPGSSMPAMPARGAEALPQGRAMLFGQMRDRAPQLSARRARTSAHAFFRIRDSAPREAEGQAHLSIAGKAVRALLRGRRADARYHRRESVGTARAPAR